MTDTQQTPARLLYIILKNRGFVIKTLLLVMLPLIGITYLLPESYTVTTVILPPEEQQMGGLSFGGVSAAEIAGLFGTGMGYSVPMMTTLGDVYVTILNSRALIDHVMLKTNYLERVKLGRRYERQPHTAIHLARKVFMKNYRASTTSAGFIQIEMTTNCPEYSILVSEEIVASLDSINTWVLTSRQREDLILVESQLAAAESSLAATSEALLNFEETYGFIEPDAVLTQFMAVLGEMKARYLETVVTANAMRSGVRQGTVSRLLELDAEAAAIRHAITELETGRSIPEGSSLDIGIRIDLLPVAMLEYARLRTDYDLNLRLVSSLNITRDNLLVKQTVVHSTLRILDVPRHPGWKSRPKKLMIWILFFVGTSFLLCCYLLARERWHELKTEKPEAWNRWNHLLKEVRKDFSRKRG